MLAVEKGRPFAFGFMLSLFLSPFLGMPILLLLKNK